MTLFYGDLAPLWPLISPVEDYAEEAKQLIALLRARAPNARSLLELGSGGGHLAYYLKRAFTCHLTDLSEPMLRSSQRLNPTCAHTVGDMRMLALGETFDLVVAHDAIDYMVSEADLRAAFATAWRHLEPGGLACFIPDDLADTYEGGTDVSGGDAVDGTSVRLFEWNEAPVPGANTVVVHYTFMVRDRSGTMRVHYEAHTTGLFPRTTWESLLTEQGFDVDVVREVVSDEDREGRTIFLAQKRS
jgi:SAM-dependent methyltransferase